jgi:hypothetical protein
MNRYNGSYNYNSCRATINNVLLVLFVRSLYVIRTYSSGAVLYYDAV